jgi:hypothetical protein
MRALHCFALQVAPPVVLAKWRYCVAVLLLTLSPPTSLGASTPEIGVTA